MKDAVVTQLHKVGVVRKLAKRLMRGTTVRQPFHGGIICLDAVEHSWAWTGERRYETFDRDVQDALLELSRKHEIFLDLGCNIGAMTLSVLLRNADIRAICVDPNTRAVKLLRESLRINRLMDRAEVFEAAVSDEEKSLRFNEAGSVTGHVTEGAGREVKSLEFTRLIDTYADQKRCLVKVDVEGFEVNLLNSLKKANGLKNVCLMIELHPHGYNGIGDPNGCLKLLRSSGATVTDLNGTELREAPEGVFSQALATWSYV